MQASSHLELAYQLLRLFPGIQPVERAAWGNPKFCVTAKSGANREKFIMGGRREKRLPPC